MEDQINEKVAPLIYVSTWRDSFDIAPYGRYSIDASISDYITRVQAAGAVALQIPRDTPEHVPQILAGADALILIGGADIDPSCFGEANAGSRGTNIDADRFDLALVEYARATGLPLFAICRGHQVLNVALGGTLDQDIDQSRITHSPPPAAPGETGSVEHEITIDADSVYLREAIGDHAIVNSIHHQAIERCAAELRVVARATDGTVEAVEPADPDWLALGVQWHPEKMESGQRLFDWFVDRVQRQLPASRRS